MDFALYAQACGGNEFSIKDPIECGAIVKHALAEPGPRLVEAVLDLLEPQLLAKITLDQTTRLAESLIRVNRIERR